MQKPKNYTCNYNAPQRRVDALDVGVSSTMSGITLYHHLPLIKEELTIKVELNLPTRVKREPRETS